MCKRLQTSIPMAAFEHAVPANQEPQTRVFDREATGNGISAIY
jgi:hypothetical protein